jgi:hypothetical protein
MVRSTRYLLHHLLPFMGIAILVFSGCAGQSPPAAIPFHDSPEAALRVFEASSAGMPGITATTRITIDRNGDHFPLKVATMIRRPDFLRVESIPVMGPPDFFLSIAGGELRVFFPGKSAFYIGRANSRNISRFLPVSLPAPEMISLLMGVPPDAAEEIQTMKGNREEGLYRIDQYGSERRIRSLWIDPAGGKLVRFQRFTEDGAARLTVDLADHVRIGDFFLPRKVTIREKETGTLTIRHTDIRQFAADPESFPLQIPEGITPIPLDQ